MELPTGVARGPIVKHTSDLVYIVTRVIIGVELGALGGDTRGESEGGVLKSRTR